MINRIFKNEEKKKLNQSQPVPSRWIKFHCQADKLFWYLKRKVMQSKYDGGILYIMKNVECGGGPPTWNHDIVWVTQFEINELEFWFLCVITNRHPWYPPEHKFDFELPNYASQPPPSHTSTWTVVIHDECDICNQKRENEALPNIIDGGSFLLR